MQESIAVTYREIAKEVSIAAVQGPLQPNSLTSSATCYRTPPAIDPVTKQQQAITLENLDPLQSLQNFCKSYFYRLFISQDFMAFILVKKTNKMSVNYCFMAILQTL